MGVFYNRKCSYPGCAAYQRNVYGEKWKLGQPYGYVSIIKSATKNMFPIWSPGHWHAICLLANGRKVK